MLYEYFLWTVFFVWVILSKQWTLAKGNTSVKILESHFTNVLNVFNSAFWNQVKGWARISDWTFKKYATLDQIS